MPGLACRASNFERGVGVSVTVDSLRTKAISKHVTVFSIIIDQTVALKVHLQEQPEAILSRTNVLFSQFFCCFGTNKYLILLFLPLVIKLNKDLCQKTHLQNI